MAQFENAEKKQDGYLNGVDGEKSSKRLVGTILTAAGGGFLLTIGIVAIYRVVADPTTSLAVGKTLLYGGLGLLGVGVVERIRPKGGTGK